MHIRKKLLPPPWLIKKELPLQEKERAFIDRARIVCRQIVEGASPLLAVIVGPCSIHDEESTVQYGLRLQKLAREVSGSIFLVMRLFFEKPRTQLGWKGILYDPDLDGSNDVAKGIRQARKLLLTMAHLGVPCASELLDPLAGEYLSDLISWGFVGARTSASPLHRQMASGLSFPIGFKNSLQGEVEVAAFAVLASQSSHTHLGIDEQGHISEIKTSGNLWTHVVLRGSQMRPNFDPASIAKAQKLLKKYHLSQRLLIDCAHGNSKKNPEQQKVAFTSVLEQIKKGNDALFGVMLESHLFEGRQPLERILRYGVSITDPCLGWEETEKMIRLADQELSLCSSINSFQK